MSSLNILLYLFWIFLRGNLVVTINHPLKGINVVFDLKTSLHINKCPQSYFTCSVFQTQETNSVVSPETDLFTCVIPHRQDWRVYVVPDHAWSLTGSMLGDSFVVSKHQWELCVFTLNFLHIQWLALPHYFFPCWLAIRADWWCVWGVWLTTMSLPEGSCCLLSPTHTNKCCVSLLWSIISPHFSLTASKHVNRYSVSSMLF